jgi:hypothetical protein
VAGYKKTEQLKTTVLGKKYGTKTDDLYSRDFSILP